MMCAGFLCVNFAVKRRQWEVLVVRSVIPRLIFAVFCCCAGSHYSRARWVFRMLQLGERTCLR